MNLKKSSPPLFSQAEQFPSHIFSSPGIDLRESKYPGERTILCCHRKETPFRSEEFPPVNSYSINAMSLLLLRLHHSNKSQTV
mmetsp:Transcript_19942/g.31694  ORF Transcript_19942/g.31694 Transcript_19942/m.31694 type:complete len:83 (-) Transcript_19942:1160-1408(-)